MYYLRLKEEHAKLQLVDLVRKVLDDEFEASDSTKQMKAFAQTVHPLDERGWRSSLGVGLSFGFCPVLEILPRHGDETVAQGSNELGDEGIKKHGLLLILDQKDRKLVEVIQVVLPPVFPRQCRNQRSHSSLVAEKIQFSFFFHFSKKKKD